MRVPALLDVSKSMRAFALTQSDLAYPGIAKRYIPDVGPTDVKDRNRWRPPAPDPSGELAQLARRLLELPASSGK